MSTKTVELPLASTDGTNGWLNLANRIATERAANDADNLPTNCQSLDIISPNTNADGTRLEITSDPVDFVPAYRLLKEEHKEFLSPLRSNNISTMDKWIRIVDAAGDPTDGSAIATIQYA